MRSTVFLWDFITCFVSQSLSVGLLSNSLSLHRYPLCSFPQPCTSGKTQAAPGTFQKSLWSKHLLLIFATTSTQAELCGILVTQPVGLGGDEGSCRTSAAAVLPSPPALWLCWEHVTPMPTLSLSGQRGQVPQPGARPPSHVSWASSSLSLCLKLLFACRDPSRQESGLTSPGPGRTLQGAPTKPMRLSLLLRPFKHSPGAESEKKDTETPGLMMFIQV